MSRRKKRDPNAAKPWVIGTAEDGVITCGRQGSKNPARVGSPDDFMPGWPLEVKKTLVVCLSAQARAQTQHRRGATC